MLAAESLIKRFPGVVALKGVSFDLLPAEIHALCGENGAGKSTLIKVLGGLHPFGSYEGRVVVNRRRNPHFAGTRDAEDVGISVIYQELALVPEMTVAENVFLGSEPRRLGGLLIDGQTMYRRAKELLDQFGLHIDPACPRHGPERGPSAACGNRQGAGKRSRVLILDEPTAALTGQEVEVLLNILRDLRRRGIACIYISHKLDEVFAISDRITVLRDGSSVCTLPTAAADKQTIIRHMVGREIGELFPRRAGTQGAGETRGEKSVRDRSPRRRGGAGRYFLRGPRRRSARRRRADGRGPERIASPSLRRIWPSHRRHCRVGRPAARRQFAATIDPARLGHGQRGSQAPTG